MKKVLCVLTSIAAMTVANAGGPGSGGTAVTRAQPVGGYSSPTPHVYNAPTPYQYAETPAINRYASSSRFQGYIEVAAAMRDFVAPVEYQKTYLPLKKLATQAKIKLDTYGPLSQTAHAAIIQLVDFVSKNDQDLQSLWDIEAFYDIASDLFSMTEEVIRDIR